MNRRCSIDGCDRIHKAHGLCVAHYYRARRTGTAGSAAVRDSQRNAGPTGPEHWQWKEAPSYSAAHQRVRTMHGSATEHPCVGCGESAAHWAYTHDDPAELVDDRGRPYSADPARYRAMCVPCHKRYDLQLPGVLLDECMDEGTGTPRVTVR